MFTIISKRTGQQVPYTNHLATLTEAIKLADWNKADVMDATGAIVYTYAAPQPSARRLSPCYCDYSYHPQGC